MNTFLVWYQSFLQRVIQFMEDRAGIIPFSGIILWYLRMPFLAKVIINIIISSFSLFLFYNIGFVILQSKAKNEVLSFISAYNNSITFPIQLIYSYAFIYFFLLVGSMLPVGLLYYMVQLIHNYLLPTANRVNLSQGKKKVFICILIILFIIMASITYFIISRKIFPYMLYYLLYRTYTPGYFEQLYKSFFYHEEFRMIDYINLEELVKELNIALIIPSFITTFTVFLLYLSFKYLKPLGGKKFVLFPITSIPLVLILLFLFFLHSSQQWGALGKNLAQFDNDYVCVEYNNPQNKYESLIGIRIIQTNNLIVLRNVTNITHTIYSDKLYVKSLLERPIDSSSNSCSQYR